MKLFLIALFLAYICTSFLIRLHILSDNWISLWPNWQTRGSRRPVMKAGTILDPNLLEQARQGHVLTAGHMAGLVNVMHE